MGLTFYCQVVITITRADVLPSSCPNYQMDISCAASGTTGKASSARTREIGARRECESTLATACGARSCNQRGAVEIRAQSGPARRAVRDAGHPYLGPRAGSNESDLRNALPDRKRARHDRCGAQLHRVKLSPSAEFNSRAVADPVSILLDRRGSRGPPQPPSRPRSEHGLRSPQSALPLTIVALLASVSW